MLLCLRFSKKQIMIEGEILNRIDTLANSIKIQSISRKNTQNLSIFGLEFRQIGELLGTRIVRVFGQKYSRSE